MHVGFVDTGCQTMNEQPARGCTGTSPRRRELVGIDVDDRRASPTPAQRGYEAHAVDCRDPDAVRALGLAPADLVVAGEVIEHLDDPRRRSSTGCTRSSRPAACSSVTTPNACGRSNVVAAPGTSRSTTPTTW